MPNTIDEIIPKMHNYFEELTKTIKNIMKLFFSRAKEISFLVREKIEEEKLKWDLKKKYIVLGKYVSEQKELKSKTDFSNDKKYLQLLSEVVTFRLFLDERTNKK